MCCGLPSSSHVEIRLRQVADVLPLLVVDDDVDADEVDAGAEDRLRRLAGRRRVGLLRVRFLLAGRRLRLGRFLRLTGVARGGRKRNAEQGDGDGPERAGHTPY